MYIKYSISVILIKIKKQKKFQSYYRNNLLKFHSYIMKNKIKSDIYIIGENLENIVNFCLQMF